MTGQSRPTKFHSIGISLIGNVPELYSLKVPPGVRPPVKAFHWLVPLDKFLCFETRSGTLVAALWYNIDCCYYPVGKTRALHRLSLLVWLVTRRNSIPGEAPHCLPPLDLFICVSKRGTLRWRQRLKSPVMFEGETEESWPWEETLLRAHQKKMGRKRK